MKKNLSLLILFIVIFKYSTGQTTSDIIKFNSGRLYYCKTDSSLIKDISTSLIGKNVVVEYNKITKTYIIKFQDAKNEIQVINLKFNKYLDGEYKICESYYQNAKFYIIDILQMGVLSIFKDQENANKGSDVYRIEGAILDNECKIDLLTIPQIDLNKEFTINTILMLLTLNKSYDLDTQNLRLNILKRNYRN